MKFKTTKAGYRKLKVTDFEGDKLTAERSNNNLYIKTVRHSGAGVHIEDPIRFALAILDEFDPINGGEGWK